jgi:heat shock protein HslJ
MLRSGGAAAELERRALLERSGEGTPVPVSVQGRIVRAADPGGAVADTLVVDSVLDVGDASRCPGLRVDRPLEETAWQLSGFPEPTSEVETAGAWLRMRGETGRIEGSTGCVELSGRFDREVTRLRFGGLNAGPGTCPQAWIHEDLLEALRLTGSYRIRGDTLQLLGEDGPLATFRAPGA